MITKRLITTNGIATNAVQFFRFLAFAWLAFALTTPVKSFAQGVDPWSVSMPITLTGDGQDHVVFGTKAGATDGLDLGVDVLNPPPPPDRFDAFFQITHLFSNLTEDYRSTTVAANNWTFRITGTNGSSGTISWDASGFPTGPTPGKLEIRNGTTVLANMLAVNNLNFTGDQNLTIHYEAPQSQSCVTYNFSVATGAWYLVSLPVVPANGTLATLFPEAIAAFEWDYPTQNYVLVNSLVSGRAYWLLFLQASTAEICGQPFNSYTNNYTAQGWDMVGSVAQTSAVTDNPSGSVLAMFGWDPLTQSYTFLTPFTAQPQEGYWILIFSVPSAVSVGTGGPSVVARLNARTDLTVFYQKYGTLPPPPPSALTERKAELLPATFGLSQNYPNPFNPVTMIEYQLPEAGHVSLKIYDLGGREVRTLVDEEKPVGYHRVKWDAKDNFGQKLNSGVYLYRIQVGAYAQTRKVLLVK
jgi:hypothetical protein